MSVHRAFDPLGTPNRGGGGNCRQQTKRSEKRTQRNGRGLILGDDTTVGALGVYTARGAKLILPIPLLGNQTLFWSLSRGPEGINGDGRKPAKSHCCVGPPSPLPPRGVEGTGGHHTTTAPSCIRSLHLHVDHVSSELDVRSCKAVLGQEKAVRELPPLLAEELVAHVVSPKLEALPGEERRRRGRRRRLGKTNTHEIYRVGSQ